MARVTEQQSGVTRREVLKAGSVFGGAVLLGGGIAGCGSSGSSGTSSTKPVSVKRGGSVQIGVIGGSTDMVDAHIGADNTNASEQYSRALYAGLMNIDHAGLPDFDLAEEVTASPDARSWTVRLKPGVLFSNGKPVTADDVIFSVQRIIDPKLGTSDAFVFAAIDPKGMRKLDARTVRFGLLYPQATMQDAFSRCGSGIVPTDYDPKKPVGAGPWMLKSFDPGQRVVFSRNPHYYVSGQPYLDELVFVVFGDATSQTNAILSGAVDGVGTIDLTQVSTIKGTPGLDVVHAKTGAFENLSMRCDIGPFKDVRVRQAMRLIPDRSQLVEQVYDGYGRVGNDIPSPLDPDYPWSIPQRTQDLEQARALLKAAGVDGMSFTLVTRPETPGLVQGAVAFAQQASGAGIHVAINSISDITEYYAKYYGKAEFSDDYWFSDPLAVVIDTGALPNAPYNTPHYADPQFARLWKKAQATLDANLRKEIASEALRIFWDTSGWVIWGFRDEYDALSTKFTGLVPDAAAVGINGGHYQSIARA